jgi:probable phosphoglycerate mutase
MIRPPKPSSGRLLFAAPEKPANVFVANVDGASRGNPGPASYAVIVRGPDGSTCFEAGKYIGRTTNNVAEYYALISALDYAVAQGIDRLLVRSDSELLVRQMEGRYKVKSPDLRPLYEHARKLARGLAYFAVEHVPRERNRDADELANIALDRTSSSGGANIAAGAKLDPNAGQKPEPEAAANRGAKASARDSSALHNSALHTSAPHSSARTGGEPALDRVSDRASERVVERTIRARYSGGALHPLGPLDLAEDEIVEISIRRPRNPS